MIYKAPSGFGHATGVQMQVLPEGGGACPHTQFHLLRTICSRLTKGSAIVLLFFFVPPPLTVYLTGLELTMYIHLSLAEC